MKYIIKCENCNKQIGEVENPTDPEKAISGYYCGTTSTEDSCAYKWYNNLTDAQRKKMLAEEKVQKEKMIKLIKEMKLKKMI